MGPARILIVGGGPTGLGAAWRLHEAGHPSWRLIEASPVPGGLSRSVTDEHGFTWDLGPHVLHSHYAYFDDVMDRVLAGGWAERRRSAWVWLQGRFVPYPLQENLKGLPPVSMARCTLSLLAARARGGARRGGSFARWIEGQFGRALADLFMLPYNRKVWASEPAQMSDGWIRDRVPPAPIGRLLQGVLLRRDWTDWGPNATFRYPLEGGTGAIWKAVAATLPPERLSFGKEAVAIDTERREAVCADGERLPYDALLSTMPIDRLAAMLEPEAGLSTLASRLRRATTTLVGLGFRGRIPEAFRDKSWIYFPGAEFPIYRATVLSNFAAANAPRTGDHWSILCEIGERPEAVRERADWAAATLAALRGAGLVASGAPLSVWGRRLPYGYPVPTLDRDELLARIEAGLRPARIWNRGRFGGWKYEVANQDHSFMQGVEFADHVLTGKPELTYPFPDRANAGRGRR